MSGKEVRNDRRTRLMAKIILGQLAFGILIAIISIGILAYGEGYRFNLVTFKFDKTGVIHLEFLPHDATVTVNGISDQDYSSFTQNARPGFYSVSVAKDSYTTWLTQFRLESASVNDYRNIVLFKSNIEPQVLTDQGKISLINAPLDVLAANSPGQLQFNSYEIWIDQNLVTRFAEPIQNAIWYPDTAHVVYQQGDEIRVIEINGQNDTLLVNLSSKTKTKYAIGSRGTELYYLDGDTYKIAVIH